MCLIGDTVLERWPNGNWACDNQGMTCGAFTHCLSHMGSTADRPVYVGAMCAQEKSPTLPLFTSHSPALCGPLTGTMTCEKTLFPIQLC